MALAVPDATRLQLPLAGSPHEAGLRERAAELEEPGSASKQHKGLSTMAPQ